MTIAGADPIRHSIPSRRRRQTGGIARPVASIVAFVAMATASVVSAVDDIALEVERVEGAGWSAEGIAIRFALPTQATSARATIRRLKLAASAEELRNVRIECTAVDISSDTLACPDARIVADVPTIGTQNLSGKVVFGRRTGALDVQLAGLRIGKGRANVRGAMKPSGWSADIDLDDAAVEPLVKLARDWKVPLPQLSATGLVTLKLQASGSRNTVRRAQIDARFTDLTANNEAGSLATEKLSFAIRAEVERSGGDWLFATAVKSNSGQAYAQPVFLDLGAHSLALNARGKWANGVLGLEYFKVDHQDVAQAEGSATVDFDHQQPVRAMTVDLKALQFPGAYESYFQPLLLDTNFKAMKTSGVVAGHVLIEQGAPQRIDLSFAAVTMDDGMRTLVLNDLQGDWHWRDFQSNAGQSNAGQSDAEQDAEDAAGPVQVENSLLRWRSGVLLNLDLGASELRFNTRGREFRLLQRTRIPVLDGAIDLETFRVRNAGQPKVAFMVDATIQPIDVQLLCKAFGWPEFGGSIGGAISKLRMRDGVVTLGTTLQAQVFDGNVTIKDLRLEQPFGQWPRFYSSIALDNLDLELVTRAFSFGRITGRLSGAIDGLQLFNWTPVAFDAHLYTPANDRSRHRISQRAVQNIGSIGGGGAGVAGALSSGFMRFFDDFNYDRLGVSCRLEQDVCVMDGVAPAPNGGYYLVKGKGLPRIDVIGSARRVDWPRLVQQLIAATQSKGPIVQ